MPHHVTPMIDGDYLSLDFTCDEPEGAICRLTCPPEHSCEEFHVVMVDGIPWHEGYALTAKGEDYDGPLHPMVARDSCGILEWDDLAECFNGPAGPLVAGEVVFEWTGDGYEWHYAASTVGALTGSEPDRGRE